VQSADASRHTWSSESSQIWTMSRSRGQSKAATWSMATCTHDIGFFSAQAAAGWQLGTVWQWPRGARVRRRFECGQVRHAVLLQDA
jgi:hypothetical protein